MGKHHPRDLVVIGLLAEDEAGHAVLVENPAGPSRHGAPTVDACDGRIAGNGVYLLVRDLSDVLGQKVGLPDGVDEEALLCVLLQNAPTLDVA